MRNIFLYAFVGLSALLAAGVFPNQAEVIQNDGVQPASSELAQNLPNKFDPKITQIQTDCGKPACSQWNIYGTNFGQKYLTRKVLIDGKEPTTYLSWSNTKISVLGPCSKFGHPFHVGVFDGAALVSNEFIFTWDHAVISDFNPKAGPSGTIVHFDLLFAGAQQGTWTLKMGNLAMPFTSWSGKDCQQKATAIVPLLAPGTYDFVLMLGSEKIFWHNTYKFTVTAAAPQDRRSD